MTGRKFTGTWHKGQDTAKREYLYTDRQAVTMTANIDDFWKNSSMRPVWGAQINDGLYESLGKSLICKGSENDTFRFPQINIGSQKAAIRLFATLSTSTITRIS